MWDASFASGLARRRILPGHCAWRLLQGIDVEGRGYGGGWFDWLTPFSVLTGVSLVGGYALLGATWLIMKTSDAGCETRCYALTWAQIGIGGAGLALVAVSAATPLLDPEIARRWFSWPNLLYLSPVPGALVALLAILLGGAP